MRYFLLFASAAAFLNAAEPSAFGAGNLESEQPYGLSGSEKSIFENKKNLQKIKSDAASNAAQLSTLRERLDGLQTIIEGLNDKAQQNRLTLGELNTQQAQSDASRDEKTAALEASVAANVQNIGALKGVIDEIAVKLDAVAASYVSKEEFNRLVEEVNAFKSAVAKELKTGSGTAPQAAATESYEGMSSKKLAAEAKSNYDRLYFKFAIPQYEELIRRNYKPAYAHYMIGEMWHYRKEWAKALSYYKESAARYSKARYMPTLMLHSAECMEKTGDSANAASFLQALLAKYPDSKEAAAARQMLDRLP